MRALALLLLLSACEASTRPGAQCARTSDCIAPLVCAIGRCREGCADSRDCPSLARCLVEPTSMMRVCSLPSTDDCAAHDCPLGFVCRVGQCLNACGDIVRCPDGVCDGTACIPSHGAPVDGGPADAPMTTSWTLTIAQDSDDGEVTSGSVLTDGESGDTDAAGEWATSPTWAFVRFALPDSLPASARVIDARLHVNGLGTAGLVSDTQHLAVVADDTADAPLVSAATDYPGGPTGSPATSASTIWGPLTDWAIGPSTSPDLSAVLQELVDHHGGLAAGSHVRLWIRAIDYTSDGEVLWQDTVAASGGPTLVVTWIAP